MLFISHRSTLSQNIHRRIIITKIKNNKKEKEEDAKTLPQFKLGNRAQEYLQHHLQQHPPSMEEKYIVETEGPIVDTYMMSLREVTPSTYHNLYYNEKDSSSQQAQRAETHRLAQIAKTQHAEYSRKQRDRAKLPAYTCQENICDTIRKNYVTIIAGDTGCGVYFVPLYALYMAFLQLNVDVDSYLPYSLLFLLSSPILFLC